MNFFLKPSLEHTALIKIVISLWNQNDVRALIEGQIFETGFCLLLNVQKNIEELVVQKALLLSLPQLLKEKVLGFIKPIGLEIFAWMRFHCRAYYIRVPYVPFELFWTPQGTIDRKKTAEVIIRDENLDLSTRYTLACIYCLENDIPELWASFTEDLKKTLLGSDLKYIRYWTKGSGRENISHKTKFKYWAGQCNKVGAEYFLQKLTPAERKVSLIKTAKDVDDAHVLVFLLSKMDEVQQMKIFRKKPYIVLQSCLEWPFQSFFIGVANCVWDFLPNDCYESLLGEIIDKVRQQYPDWNYQNLFRVFWQKSPNALKSFVLSRIDENLLLSLLFEMKDNITVRSILEDATLTVKQKLIRRNTMKNFLRDCIHDNEWGFLKLYFREFFSSENEKLKFKEEFEKCIKWDNVEDKNKWDQLFSFESICKSDKRSAKEGESSSSKRFRSLE